MRRFGFWLRWSGRDLRMRWPLVTTIALVIAIGTGLYTAIGSLETWREQSNDASYARLNAHDLRIELPDGAFARRGSMRHAVRSVSAGRDVARTQERLIVPTQVNASRPGHFVLTPGRIVGTEVGGRGPPIDAVSRASGRKLTTGDSGRPVAVLEESFARYHDLPDHGTLRLAGGTRLRWVGTGQSPEYFVVISPGGGDFGAAEASFGVVFTSLATAQRLAGRPGAVNDAVLKLRPGADPQAAASALQRQLRARFAGLGADVSALSADPAHRILYKDAQGDQKVWNIFSLLILFGAAFAAFNLATRIVEAQRREIGVGMALGVSPRRLALRPMLLGMEIAVLGVIFGIAIGVWAAGLFAGVLRDLLPLPEIVTPFQTGVFVRGAVLGFLLPVLATALPVWRGVRVAPIEAIRVGFRSAKGHGLSRLGERLPLPGRTLGRMPVRNVLRTPRRTAMTVLGIAAVITVLIGLLGMIDSFLATADRSAAETAGAHPSRLVATLDGFQSERSAAIRRVEALPDVGAVTPRIVVPARLSTSHGRFDVIMEARDAESALWRPSAAKGRLGRGSTGISIARKAAGDLGVDVGDLVTVRLPRRTGPLSFELRDVRLRVAAIHPNPFRTFAYMDSSQAGLLGLRGQANAIDVLPKPGVSTDAVRRALFFVPGVASVQKATATTEALRERMDDFIGIFRVIEFFALALALLIAFNSASISADERSRESATMFAFGVPVRRTLGMAVVENLIVGALGTVLGIALGMVVVGWVVNAVTPNTIPELGTLVSLSAGSVIAAALIGVVAVSAAPVLTVRRLRRMDIPSTLRVVE